MTQHTLRRRAALLTAMTLTLGPVAVIGAQPATAAPRSAEAPTPCTPPAAAKSNALPADDNAAAQAANDARVAKLRSDYPDRQLSAYSNLNEVGEGWRYGWKGGRMRYVSFLNRAGAMLVGTAFAPDPARCPGRRPAVLLTEGITANEVLYWWQAQSLAEAGYVVFTFDYMNQGLSEASGHDDDGSSIAPVGGERGTDPATGFLQDAQDALDLMLSSPAQPYRVTGPLLASDAGFDTTFPFASQVDPRFVGLTGHSEGARIASVLQGLDRRVGALVALDNLATRLKGDQGSANSQCVEGGIGTDTMPVTPRVPALGQAAPNNTICNDPELKKFAYEKWRAAGLPAMQVVIAGSKHGDWAPSPAGDEGNADVPELAAHWSIAWFDRWLLADPGAELRLLTRTFDLFDHYTGAFRRTAPEVYDTSFISSAATGTNTCPDLRVACQAVLPVLSSERPPGRSGHGTEPSEAQPGEDPTTVRGPAALTIPDAPSTVAGSGPGPSTAPAVAAPSVATTPFAATSLAATTSGTGALVALPAAGALLGLLVLIGFRRHESTARRLGAAAA